MLDQKLPVAMAYPPHACPAYPAAGGAGPVVRGSEAAPAAPCRSGLPGAGRDTGAVALRGHKDSFHIHLEPGLAARVAAEAFGLDPARLTLPPLDALALPRLGAAMLAVYQ